MDYKYKLAALQFVIGVVIAFTCGVVALWTWTAGCVFMSIVNYFEWKSQINKIFEYVRRNNADIREHFNSIFEQHVRLAHKKPDDKDDNVS
jgi:hypothetical protein